MLTKNRILLAKEEATYGNDPTPTVASNAIEARNVKVNYTGDLLERDVMRGHLSPIAPIMGKRWIEVSFEFDLKGGGTKGTAARIGDLLEACGMAETASAGSSVTYLPSSQSHKSVTIYVYDNVSSSSSKLHKITGARGTWSIKMEAGQLASMSFNFKGLYNDPTDVAAPASPTYESTLPPVVESSTFTLNSSALLIAQAINLELANDIVSEDDINTANAIKSFLITGRKAAGSLNPETMLKASYDYHTDWKGATSRALSVVLGSASGNKITITAPALTIDSIGDGDNSGIKTDDLPFRLSGVSGNDEVQLKFE